MIHRRQTERRQADQRGLFSEDHQVDESHAAPRLEWVSSGSRPYYYRAEGLLGDYSRGRSSLVNTALKVG